LASVGAAGVTPIDTSAAGVTVNVTPGEVTPPKAAVIDVVPTATAVAWPSKPAALLIVAVVGTEELHVTAVVRTCIELSV
jgi:hypothetical protein